MVEDPEDVPEYMMEQMGFGLHVQNINLSDLAGLQPKERAKLVSEQMGSIDREDPEEDDDYDLEDDEDAEWKAILENVRQNLINAKSRFKTTMETEWGEKVPKSVTVKMNFGGFGEMLANSEEFLEAIYGYCPETFEYFKLEEDSAVDMLAKDNPFTYVDKDSIRKLVRFIKNFERDFPDEIEFTQTLGQEGVVRYEFG